MHTHYELLMQASSINQAERAFCSKTTSKQKESLGDFVFRTFSTDIVAN